MVTVIPPPGPATRDFSGCRTLVLQPDAPNRRLLSQMLTGLGVGRLDACGSLRDAWRLLAEDRFNSMFLDWSVELDAVAFLKELRALSNPHRMLPVVVTTGFVEPHYIGKVTAIGANEVLLKPYSHDSVAHRLDALVREPRLFIRSDTYFGPDRRRRRVPFAGAERRSHQNWCAMDRRRDSKPPPGQERRQGQPGFTPIDRRSAPRDRFN